MGTARFHAVTNDYVENTCLYVQSLSGIENLASTRDTVLSGTCYTDSSASNHHVRKCFKLAVPTFNFVLGRSDMTLLWKVLGINSTVGHEIVHCDLIWDCMTGELVSSQHAQIGGAYKYAAEVAEQLIFDMDVEKRKMECLYSTLGAFCSSGTNPRDMFTIDRSNNGIQLVDGYWAHLKETPIGKLKRGVTLDDIAENYGSVIFKNNDSAYTYLCNMKSKDSLYGMLNYYIIVLPDAMHPMIDKRKHKLTKRYEYVIKTNNELFAAISSGVSPNEMIEAHRALNSAVSKLQYKLQKTSADVKPDDQSILERIKGKEGQIRRYNLGKRQDYSGRAVVVINPFLPVDVIRVPRTMLPSLFEYHALKFLADGKRSNVYNQNHNQHVANVYDRVDLTNIKTPMAREEINKIIEREHLLDKVPVILGRQPTLHRQSLQAFHAEPTDFQAIEVNPNVCVAFNMDFDGDQGHIEIPLSDAAIKEARDLLLITQNLFFAKTGSSSIEPRQDMLYGLYMCTRTEYKTGEHLTNLMFDTYDDIRTAVIKHNVRPWETVGVLEGGGDQVLAGDAALIACYPKGVLAPRDDTKAPFPVCQFYKKTLGKYMGVLLKEDEDGNFQYPIGERSMSRQTITGVINLLVELGFKVARLYPKSMSLVLPGVTVSDEMSQKLGLTKPSDFSIGSKIANFHESMEELDLLYNLGLEIDENYRLAFDGNLDHLSADVGSNLLDVLGGPENGYVALSVSGARGSIDNLNQAFAYKGRVKKNSTESFDALIENSYATQLTPMEGMVTAYGGRQGQIDKSLKTGDTGYAMRQQWHGTQGCYITCEDCGTTQGITLNKKELTLYSDADTEEEINNDVESIFAYAIRGRYRVGSHRPISEAEANALAHDPKTTSITIRSPLTCSNPCCSYCYGVDWTTHKRVVVGTPVGLVAAQSIGEPGTQLTLNQFHSGGVAGKKEMMSAFDKVVCYIHMSNLAERWSKGHYPGYDPIAWATGKIIETPASTVGQKRVTIEGAKGKSIIVPNDTVFRSEVVKGEGIAYKHGDYDIHELIKYNSLEYAQKYLVFKLYSFYRSEAQIRPIHFETLVTGMLRFMILETDRSDLMVGQYCTRKELYSGDMRHTRYEPRIVGVKKLPEASMDALDAIVMESQGHGLSRVCLLGMQDSLTKPLNRMLLGLSTKQGSAIPGYIENRKERI